VLTCSGDRLARVRNAVNPATEKTVSDLVYVAGTARYFLAIRDSLAYEDALPRKDPRGVQITAGDNARMFL
jgi:hypothetical protein